MTLRAAGCSILVALLSADCWAHVCISILPKTVSKPDLDHHIKLIDATMNTSLTNTTSSCPSFLAGNPYVTVAYCGLPLCANTTAVMAECCAGSQVFPYHSVGGPDFHDVENFTDLNALWCQVDNSSAPA